MYEFRKEALDLGGDSDACRSARGTPQDFPIQTSVVRIRPTTRWSWIDWREMWEYRDLLRSLAVRDLKLRYRQTALGILWVVFQPVAGAGVFTLVFGWVAGLKTPGDSYFLKAMSGLLIWNAFQSTLGKASMALLGNAALVSKVYFPRLLLPLSTVLSSLVDFGIGLTALILVGLCTGWHPVWSDLIGLPLWLALALGSSLGAGLLAASFMTRYRDVQHVLPMLLPYLMYLSPVGYAVSAAPEQWRKWFEWNPVAWMLEGSRAALIGGPPVPWEWACYAALTSLVLLTCGISFFRQMERSFADVH